MHTLVVEKVVITITVLLLTLLSGWRFVAVYQTGQEEIFWTKRYTISTNLGLAKAFLSDGAETVEKVLLFNFLTYADEDYDVVTDNVDKKLLCGLLNPKVKQAMMAYYNKLTVSSADSSDETSLSPFDLKKIEAVCSEPHGGVLYE